MKLNELLKLIDTVKDSDFSEFHFQTQDIQLTLRRGTETAREPLTTYQKTETLPPSPPVQQAQTQDSPTREEGLIEVTAPMVGTFYRAPSPDAEPFVKPGDVVESGDTLCILEAMKLMNEIEAETDGEVVTVAVENGQLVEFGQLLITLRPVKT